MCAEHHLSRFGRRDIEVGMGDIAVAGCKYVDNLFSTGIGSCIVITIYDHVLKHGALAHSMLPLNSKPKDKEKIDATYIETAIELMISNLLSLGSVRKNLEAKVIGGANMFSAFKSNISERNISCARDKLKEEHIQLVGECIGGYTGRSVEFSLDTGVKTRI